MVKKLPKGYFTGIKLLILKKRELVAEAMRQARVNGRSYRNFNVGCVALAYNGKHFDTFGAANLKRRKEGMKVCAETQAIRAAKFAGYNHIVAIVVIGEPQEDHGSGQKPLTLHPCADCRRRMMRLYKRAGLVTEHTLIYTVRLDGSNISELHTLQELDDYHKKVK